jgi:imidazolonepropionase-like amidohydrolase
MRFSLAAIVASMLMTLTAAATAADAAKQTALHCGHLIDTQAGKLLGESTVVIDGNRIGSVAAGHQVPAGTAEIDLSSQFCMPGLIDSHTHLSLEFNQTTYVEQFHLNSADYAIRSTVFARRTLLAGFTAVRNLEDRDNETVALRNAINAGYVPGPRIFTSGNAIGSTGGHADWTNSYRKDLAGDPGPLAGVINGVDDARKAVRQRYKDNDDLIKIMASGGVLDEGTNGDNPQMTLEEIQAVVSTAHDYGFTVAAHAHGTEAIRRAVIGGVDSVEHASFMNEEDMRLMKERGTWYVPTLTAGDAAAQKAKIPGYYPPQVAAKAAAIGPQLLGTARRAYKAGLKIAFGTDAGVYPHGENARELELMVQAGMPPMFVIQAATTHAAELLKHDKDLGSIMAGKLADLVAVPANPLDDVSVLKRVGFIMKDGVVYKQDGKATDADLRVDTRPIPVEMMDAF